MVLELVVTRAADADDPARHELGDAQVAQAFGDLAPPFGETGSSPLEERPGPGDLELGLELGDGLAGLGQLVGLEALDALGLAGVNQRLALPRVERGL